MAFSNTYDTTAPGAAVSNREDLTDLLTVLAPTDTPVLSLAPKRKAKATNHEWTVDKLATPDTSGVNEGADISSFEDKFEGQDRLGNYVQGFQRSAMVSQVQNAVDSVQANFAKAQVKSLQELKRDIEATIVSDNDKSAGSASSAPAMRGLGGWIDQTIPSEVSSNYLVPAAQDVTGAVTEAVLTDALASMFTTSGDFNNVTMVADVEVRKSISEFTRSAGAYTNVTYKVNQDASEKKVTLAVDFYESDFGMIRIVNSNPACSADTTNNDRAFILDFSKLGWADLIPLKQYTLENQGGGQRGYCECWGTLEVLDPRAHAKLELA